MTGQAVAGGEIVVGVGDCRIASSPSRSLATFALGSCIAVVAWDWKLRIGGLLHVMLPNSELRTSVVVNPFVFVDLGLAELLKGMEARGVPRKRMRCSVAGGASMMAESSSLEIGKRNCLAVRRECWKQGVFIEREDVGGNDSRSVRLDLVTGKVELRTGLGELRILAAPSLSLAAGVTK